MLRELILGAMTASAVCVLPVVAAADEFHLSCGGIGPHLEATTTYGSASFSNGGSASGSATAYSRAQSPDRLVIEIDQQGSRIRVPTTIIPPLHGGGKDGWWTLTDVNISDSEISGRFSLNPINKPRVRIDRRTGDLSIEGFGKTGFRGACEKFEPSPAERKF